MSGIVGIVNLDGVTIDQNQLARLTSFMTKRGPDSQETLVAGHVGFGHTLLRTTFESQSERQPLTLDGKVILTADARIDGRLELIAKLEKELDPQILVLLSRSTNSTPVASQSTFNDALLILGAYHLWGADCVEHLLGDYAFAIWDTKQQSLFCARDHFGVKPFYYSRKGNSFLFSNTLNCLRQHPSVSSKLNEKAVGDFLLFEMNYDPSATIFADIQRLPPAHILICNPDGSVKLHRYWSLPTGGQIRYKNDSDYVEHFKELMDAATRDRLRTNNVGIFMSGGLDSTTIAATAKSLLSSSSGPFDLQAYTIFYESLIPDDEKKYAELASRGLGIRLNLFNGDDYKLFERSDEPQMWRPEPIPNPFMSLTSDYYEQIARNCRVVLSGQGPDAVLSTHFAKHTKALLAQGRHLTLLADFFAYLVWNKRIPAIGVRTFIRNLFRNHSAKDKSLPSWLRTDFVDRMELVKRFEEINQEPIINGARHPVGHSVLARPFWTFLFERDDADLSQRAIEPRYPFFDLRLVNFLLSIPVMRWCVDKKLLRQAMAGRLPEAVRLRPKTPLASDILHARMQRGDRLFNLNFDALPELNRYVIPLDERCIDYENPSELWCNLRLQVFHNWMSQTLGAQE